MQGSQITNLNPIFTGRDFGAPEVSRLGACRFRRAILTSDDWQTHDSAEAIFMLEGEACWEIGPERLIQLNGGQMGIFPPGISHRILDGVYPPSRILWLLLLPEGGQGAGILTPAEMESFRKAAMGVESPLAMDSALTHDARLLADRLEDPAILTGSALAVADARARLAATVVALWKACHEGMSSHARSRLVRDTERIMLEDLGSDISIAKISRRLDCSRGYLHLQFRRELGMSPVDYRQRLRIRRCCELLRDTELPINSIARDMGFATSQYLSRVFRKYMDTTPSEYRGKARVESGTMTMGER